MRVEMSSDDDQLYTARVTITTQEDGYTTKMDKIFTGSRAEVEAKIQSLDDVGIVLKTPAAQDTEEQEK